LQLGESGKGETVKIIYRYGVLAHDQSGTIVVEDGLLITKDRTGLGVNLSRAGRGTGPDQLCLRLLQLPNELAQIALLPVRRYGLQTFYPPQIVKPEVEVDDIPSSGA